MKFQPGQSGNPGGRPKNSLRLKEIARQHTDAAIETLVAALKAENENTRVAAANSLLDRAWGKPAQAIVGGDEDDNPVQLVAEIRRAIVDPRNPDSAGL